MGTGDTVTLKRALMPWLTWVLETEDSVLYHRVNLSVGKCWLGSVQQWLSVLS